MNITSFMCCSESSSVLQCTCPGFLFPALGSRERPWVSGCGFKPPSLSPTGPSTWICTAHSFDMTIASYSRLHTAMHCMRLYSLCLWNYYYSFYSSRPHVFSFSISLCFPPVDPVFVNPSLCFSRSYFSLPSTAPPVLQHTHAHSCYLFIQSPMVTQNIPVSQDFNISYTHISPSSSSTVRWVEGMLY